MTEIGFYHLTRTGIDDALPQLLGKTLKAGQRAVVRCQDAAQVKALDDALWKVKTPFWLPHGSQDQAARQPIWLTHRDEAPNNAQFLFLLEGAAETGLERFARIFALFDGKNQAALERARALWRMAREAEFKLAYWQQQDRGWTQTQ